MVRSSRSLYAAMEDASSPRVSTTLSFMSSSSSEAEDSDDRDGDDAKEAGEEPEQHKRNTDHSSDDALCDGGTEAIPSATDRCRTRSAERLDVCGGKEKPYSRRLRTSPRKMAPQRCDRKKSSLTRHGRDVYVRKSVAFFRARSVQC